MWNNLPHRVGKRVIIQMNALREGLEIVELVGLILISAVTKCIRLAQGSIGFLLQTFWIMLAYTKSRNNSGYRSRKFHPGVADWTCPSPQSSSGFSAAGTPELQNLGLSQIWQQHFYTRLSFLCVGAQHQGPKGEQDTPSQAKPAAYTRPHCA